MTKILKEVLNYSQQQFGGTDLVVAFKDYFCHYHGIGDKFDKSMQLSDKKIKIDYAMKEKIANLANVGSMVGLDPMVLATSPNYQWATFAVVGTLVDAVLPDALIDSIGMYADLRFGGYGDSANIRIKPRDLFVVSKGGKNNLTTEIYKQYDGNKTLSPEFRDISVATSLYRVLAGEEDMAEFAMKAAKSLEVQMTYDAYTAFASAMTALPTTGSNSLKTAGYSQADMLKKCQQVTAWNGGKQAIILGTKSALANVLPANANFRYTLESDYVRLGYIKDFLGYSVIEMPQVADYTSEFGLKLDDKKIYIISPSSDKLIKGFIEGSLLSLVSSYENNADLTQTTTMKKSYVFAVATSSIGATIELA